MDTIFSLPGNGINGIYEVLRIPASKIRVVQVRHEEAAACAYAKYSGRLGVCLAASGPGGVHLLNGLYDAKFDGQPVLAITGHTLKLLLRIKLVECCKLSREDENDKSLILINPKYN